MSTTVDKSAGRREYSPEDIARSLGLPPPTAEQVAIITGPLAPAVVIAGAGSGKTETMAARVVWLVANGLVGADRILGLTFTRKAASELHQRVSDRLRRFNRAIQSADDYVDPPTVLTYAAYAGRLVDEHSMLLGHEPGSLLLSEAGRWQVADAVARRYDRAFTVEAGVLATVTERMIDLAGQLADHLVEPEQLAAFSERFRSVLSDLPPGRNARKEFPADVERFLDTLTRRVELLPLVELFQQAKERIGALDFADQMVLAARLAQFPSVVAAERARYDVILLDEYQDTGFAQNAMLRALFADGRAVSAVGDPLQSIYSWRGASTSNLSQFASTFRDRAGLPAREFSLMTSWRNDETILGVANIVAKPLRRHAQPALRPSPVAAGGRVACALVDTVEAEARWIAGRLRDEWDFAAPQPGASGCRTLAVLVRKRSAIAAIAQALIDAELPVEVVDLGGLLSLPEIADIRCVLHVLADHSAGGALGRLLTGARWRIGAADLVALHGRAKALAAQVGNDEERLDPSLVEALDDLGDPQRYSSTGYSRLAELGALLRRLRRRLDLPLPDLIAEIERELGLDVEVATRAESAGAAYADAGRANLARFVDTAARFVDERSGAGLTAFLSYLNAAEDEEYGLKPVAVEVQAERVQILTVHAAKGLEWDAVAVAGLVDKTFPDQPRGHDWASAVALIPNALRGDSDSLPDLDLSGCEDRAAAAQCLKKHREEVSARHRSEERRLAYVAFTRARHALYLSGAVWGSGSTPREPSEFLCEVCVPELAKVDGWYEAPDGAQNPSQSEVGTANWPADPLSLERRRLLQAGAAKVRGGSDEDRAAPGSVSPRAAAWRRDVATLLSERARTATPDVVEVPLPRSLSASTVVALAENPEALARHLRRPVPIRPLSQARTGTAFHEWLEQRWGSAALLDIDELPGSVDESVDAGELQSLRGAFGRSAWAERTPIAVEVPFEMTLGGRIIRGRMDAVFRDRRGRFTVVDWKTGRLPTGTAAQHKAIQLAIYRLAWAQLHDVPDDRLDTVSAAFHYVADNITVAPADLLDAGGLRRLIEESAGADI
jgi:DNA helicase II / ATP-dependent DNA helicase PcrA